MRRSHRAHGKHWHQSRRAADIQDPPGRLIEDGHADYKTLDRRGRMLERGMIVMTGSSITTRFPVPGDRVRFAIEGLGEAALEVTR